MILTLAEESQEDLIESKRNGLKEGVDRIALVNVLLLIVNFSILLEFEAFRAKQVIEAFFVQNSNHFIVDKHDS